MTIKELIEQLKGLDETHKVLVHDENWGCPIEATSIQEYMYDDYDFPSAVVILANNRGI